MRSGVCHWQYPGTAALYCEICLVLLIFYFFYVFVFRPLHRYRKTKQVQQYLLHQGGHVFIAICLFVSGIRQSTAAGLVLEVCLNESLWNQTGQRIKKESGESRYFFICSTKCMRSYHHI